MVFFRKKSHGFGGPKCKKRHGEIFGYVVREKHADVAMEQAKRNRKMTLQPPMGVAEPIDSHGVNDKLLSGRMGCGQSEQRDGAREWVTYRCPSSRVRGSHHPLL